MGYKVYWRFKKGSYGYRQGTRGWQQDVYMGRRELTKTEAQDVYERGVAKNGFQNDYKIVRIGRNVRPHTRRRTVRKAPTSIWNPSGSMF